MSGLFQNPVADDPNFCEAVVTSIDPLRYFCRVRTSKGQNINNVTWLGAGGTNRTGEDKTPTMGDRVVLNFSLGYPVIFGGLPRIIDSETFATPIDNGTPISDTGNYSNLARGLTANPNKPDDLYLGDQVTRSEGGGLFGVLRGGTIIAKASRLAQIVLFKLDDLVRIIGRNFEIFTDVFVDISTNQINRIYRFIGYSDTFSNTLTDTYKYNEYYGDTALGEFVKQNYSIVPVGTYPVANDIVRKYTLTNGTSGLFGSQVWHLTGQLTTTIQTIDGTWVTYTDQLNNSYTINSTHITFSSVVINPTSITLNFNNAATLVLDAAGIRGNFSGHFINIDSTGTHLG